MLNYNIIKKGFDINSLPITLDVIKNFLRINYDDPDQDKLLAKLNLIATQYAEDSMQRSIIRNKLLLCFNQGGVVQSIKLPLDPVLTVARIVTFKPNSPAQTELKHGRDYFFRQNSAIVTFMMRIPYLNRVEIEYNTGYPTIESVPSQIKEGILRHIKLLYTKSDERMDTVKYMYSDFKPIKVVL